MTTLRHSSKAPRPLLAGGLGPRLLKLLSLACLLMLGGCAAQNAFREGRTLAESGQTERALSKFEEAVRLEPGSAKYRIATINSRELLVTQALQNAERALAVNNLDVARSAYLVALDLQPGNAMASAGLTSLKAQDRHSQWLNNAEDAVKKGDAQTALTWTKMILAENPRNQRATLLTQTLENRNPAVSTSGNNALSDAYRKPISIEFKDAPLKTIFEVLSRTSGLNFLFDKDIRTEQKTSIYLKNSTVEAAIGLTLLTNQLAQRVLDGNTILIYPNNQAKQKDYQPLTIKTFYLVNTEAKTVANTLKTLLKSRDVVVDEKLNMIILRDSTEAVRMAEKLVALHDVAEPEVMLEVEILEVKRTRLLDLGVRWPDQLSLTPLAAASGGALTLADLPTLRNDTIGVSFSPATINARKLDTDANILANPRIRARNREKAKILIGERVPNITTTSTSTGFVAESVTYVDVGLKLDVEPTIYPDGEVAIKVALEVSNIINQIQTKSGSIAYQIGTRTAQTVLRLKDGENQVLAGLINDEDRRTANKVPGLGEVPIVGRLFGNQVDDSTKTEIVLSITPRILRNIQRPGAHIMEFDSGTESSLGTRQVAAPTLQSPLVAPAALAQPDGTSAALEPSPAPANITTPASPTGTNTSLAEPVATAPIPAAAQSGSSLRWQGPADLKLGDAFTVQLLMQSDQPIVSLPMAVSFDARALQVVSVTEGDFLRQSGAQTSFATRVDPSGQILITGTRAGNAGATVPGTVATINFKVISAAEPLTRVQLLTVAPIALGGRGSQVALPPPFEIKLAP
jgi:general secretion pathway protein D